MFFIARGHRRGGLNGGAHQCESKAKLSTPAPKGMPQDCWKKNPTLSGSLHQGLSPLTLFGKGGVGVASSIAPHPPPN